MDGIHDLGGRQGFGKVETDEAEEAFHSDWEARAYGIVRAMAKAPEWTKDRFRFTREQIEPADYLTRPYYDQWLQCCAAMMVGSGIANVAEVASGHSEGAGPDLKAPGPESVAAAQKEPPSTFDRPGGAPAFGVGASVTAKSYAHRGHTRLPAYVRGHTGEVVHVRGVFVLPDDSAEGIEGAEPLYTVAFKASDLWPGENLRHLVHLDLWESYLEPA